MPVSALDSLDGLAAAPGKRRSDRDIRGSGAEGFRWLKVGDDGLLWWNVVLDDEIVERSVAAAAGLVVERARFLLGEAAGQRGAADHELCVKGVVLAVALGDQALFR